MPTKVHHIPEKIELGDRVKDSLSGFEGIAYGRSTFLTGCDQILVMPDRVKDGGDKAAGMWLDDSRLRVLQRDAYSIEEPAKPGGPAERGPARS